MEAIETEVKSQWRAWTAVGKVDDVTRLTRDDVYRFYVHLEREHPYLAIRWGKGNPNKHILRKLKSTKILLAG